MQNILSDIDIPGYLTLDMNIPKQIANFDG